MRDLDIRSRLILNTLQEDIAPLIDLGVETDFRKRALEKFKKVAQDERILAMGFCNKDNLLVLKTEQFPESINCHDVINQLPHQGFVKRLESGDVHIAYGLITDPYSALDLIYGKLILLHDMSFAARRSNETKTYIFLVFLAIGVLISAITVLIAQWSRTSWVRSVQDIVVGIRRRGFDDKEYPGANEFKPILKDLKGLVKDLEVSARTKDEAQISWDAKNLKNILHQEFSGDEVVVVSNRQPYIHVKKEDKIEVISPASGLVTAMEPILKACSGVWIAHGNGSADKLVVDHRDRIKAPPVNPQYEIHRVWLSEAEEEG